MQGVRGDVHPVGICRCIGVFDERLAIKRRPKRWRPVEGYADLVRELKGRGMARPDARVNFDAVVAIRRRNTLPDSAVIGNAGSFFKHPIVTREERQTPLARYP